MVGMTITSQYTGGKVLAKSFDNYNRAYRYLKRMQTNAERNGLVDNHTYTLDGYSPNLSLSMVLFVLETDYSTEYLAL